MDTLAATKVGTSNIDATPLSKVYN